MVDLPPPGAAAASVGPGRRLAGRYRLVRPIASGGMAVVWEAVDEILTRPVAVKLLHDHLAADASFVARFRGEAINAARLTHPSIVSIYDTWSGEGTEAIVMELVHGTTLRHVLDERGSLPPVEAVMVAAHVAAALEAAHRAGIVHRDIKPANVLLSSDGRVLVTDFGIAKATEGADLTTERTMLGTAKYLAPEQVEGARVDGRADIYALGVVLYEMLCGEPPFRAETEAATALARLHRVPDPPSRHRPGLAPSLEALVLRCLARDPADRFAGADGLRAALATVDTAVTAVAVEGPGSVGASDTTTAGWSQATGPATASAPPSPPIGPSAVGRSRAEPSPGSGGEGGAPAPPARRTGRWLLAGLVAAAVVVLALLAAGMSPRGSARSVVISRAEPFDPFAPDAVGQENNAEAPLAVDDDPTTAWRTERYRNPDAMGKPGVGLIVRLGATARIDQVSVASASTGWTAVVYTADGPTGDDLSSWGAPTESKTGIPAGSVTFRLDGGRADAILLWITRPGDGGRVEVADVEVRGR